MSIKHRLQAWGELAGRYAHTFAHFWRIREQMSTGLFRADEAAFLPAALAVQEAPPSRTARWLAWILILMVSIALCWATLGRMDIIVNAQGKVIPSSYTKTIAAVENGSVVALNVQEGQHVRAGDTLLQLDTGTLDAEASKAVGDANEAILTLLRNQALLDALAAHREPLLPPLDHINAQYHSSIAAAQWQANLLHVRAQYQDWSSKWRKLADDMAYYSKQLPLAAAQAENYRQLLATNDVSRDAWQEKEQARLQLASQLAQARDDQASLTSETTKTALDQMADARRVAAESQADVSRASAGKRLLTLKSPVDGTVQQLSLHTLGGVAQAAQPLMQIVPDGGPVEVQAQINNKDKGFVHAGQIAKVKIDAFEYTKYGTVSGRVTQISEDAIPDEKHDKLYYEARVLLDKATLNVDGKDTPVIPGMSVSVEIKTGDRRVIDYVLSPLIRYTHEAGDER